jgi:lysine 2,3-aminomutase
VRHAEIRDVILSGGDLMLSDRRIEYFLKTLRAIPHVEIVRLPHGSSQLPERVTPELCGYQAIPPSSSTST